MRPIFIYNYQTGRTKKNDEFFELFVKGADKWEEVFSRGGNDDLKRSFQ